MVPVVGGFIGGTIKLVAKIIFGIFKLFSLAIIYALVGVVLYATKDFNPFSGDLYSVLYLVGFGLSVLFSLMIAFRDKGKKKGKSSKEESTWKWGKKVEPGEDVGFFERRKEKKRLKEERKAEEIELEEKLKREEEFRRQEKRLEELRAERLREEIAREERLIDEYRHEAANHALQKYEEVVGAHPIVSEEPLESPSPVSSPRYDEVNYYGGDWGKPSEKESEVLSQYKPVERPLRRENNVSKKEETNYFSALNNGYVEPKQGGSERTSNMKVGDGGPKIYMSALEPNTLIHEYQDRFEVYLLEGGGKTLKEVLYKK